MGKQKVRKAGIMDILRSPYARQFIRKYKWSYLIGMAVLILIDLAQTEVPIIVGRVIDGIETKTIGETGFVTAVLTMAAIALIVLAGASAGAIVFSARAKD